MYRIRRSKAAVFGSIGLLTCALAALPAYPQVENQTALPITQELAIDQVADQGLGEPLTTPAVKLYQMHSNGAIWGYTLQPCSGNNCGGWQLLPRLAEDCQ